MNTEEALTKEWIKYTQREEQTDHNVISVIDDSLLFWLSHLKEYKERVREMIKEHKLFLGENPPQKESWHTAINETLDDILSSDLLK